MVPSLPKGYASTKNKERVRKEDTTLIIKLYRKAKRKLSYLGMPSDEMKDILAWQDYIERASAVEIDKNKRHLLTLNLLKNNLQGKVDILFGDVEKILLDGRDVYSNKLKFPYDFVFLDFFGTILYKGFRRVDAIKELMYKQRGHYFLFFLTFNLKERKCCKNTIITELDKIKKEMCNFYVYDSGIQREIERIITWYCQKSTNEIYRQKIFVPYFVKTTAEDNNFRVHFYSPIYYRGYNNCPMIHFRFKMMPEFNLPTHSISEQSIIDIFNSNIKEANSNRVFVRKIQAPLMDLKI